MHELDVRYEVSDGDRDDHAEPPRATQHLNLELLEAALECHRARGPERRTARFVIVTRRAGDFAPGRSVGGAGGGVASGWRSIPTRRRRRYMRISERLHAMLEAAIAAINGACAGAGFPGRALTDLRYAAASAVFQHRFF